MTSGELKTFLENPREYGIVPFWFINHYPEEHVLRQQIREMASRYCSGVMIHPRDGLMGGYLDHNWEKVCRIIIDEAKKCDLKVWLYDELNFPSGPAGGKVREKFPDTAMQSLELVYDEPAPPTETFDKVLCSCGRYLGFVIRRQNQYPDYLDKDAMAEFVSLSYRWYAERFKDDFGSVIPGEFTDNSCANFGFYRRSVPWTEHIAEKFRDFCGLDLDEVLPSLFFDTPKSPLYRLHFWRFLNALYLETFVIPIEEECASNGISATGHYCLESGISEHVRQLGDRFDQKFHQQLPGVDMLGAPDIERVSQFPIGTASALLAMTASPAYFFHNSRVLCECLGLTLKWNMNLAQMRRLSAVLNVLGIDLFVPHGFYYSIGGHRKRECIPDFYHNTMWENFGQWSLFAARISALTAHSRHIADTAMFYPVTSQQAALELGPGTGVRCKRIDDAMRHTADLLIKNAVPFEVIDKKILSSARVEDGSLLIPLPTGKIHTLRTLILPSVWIAEKETAEKLAEFANSGGKVLALEETLSSVFTGDDVVPFIPPEGFFSCICRNFNDGSEDEKFIAAVKSGMRSSKVKLSGTGGKIMIREFERPDGQYFAMIQNFSCDPVEKVRISCDFEPVLLDIDSLSLERSGSRSFCHDFSFGETLFLTCCDGELPLPAPKTKRTGSCWQPDIREWRINLKDPNILRLTRMTCDYGPLRRTYSAIFEIADLPPVLDLLLDVDPTEAECRAGTHPFAGSDGPVYPRNRCIVKVNGQRVQNICPGSFLDSKICTANILPFVKTGENTIELDQCCARIETTITSPEPFILAGDFDTRENKIVSRPETLSAMSWGNEVLPNYSGTVEFSAEVSVPPELRGKIYAISFDEVKELCSLSVNGVCCGTRIMPPWRFEFDEKLSDHETLDLKITCTNTPANCWQAPVISGISNISIFWSEEPV